MRKKINWVFLILFNFTILYYLKNIISNNVVDTVGEIAKIVVLLIITIFLNFIVILFSKKEISPVKKFLIIALFVGIGYIFISPLLRGIDETAHFSRVYSFFMKENTTNSGDYKIPKAINEVGGTTEFSNVKGGNFSYLKTKIIDDDLVIANKYRGSRLYTPISYLAYLIPVWFFGFLIKTNIFTVVTSARFFGLLFYIISSVYAINTVPKRKDFFAIFCLMPAILSNASTVSGDLLTNCSIIIFIATWYKLYCEKKEMTIKDIIVMTVAGILAGYAKMVYAIELLVVFLLPKECFGGTTKKKAKILGIMITIVLVVTLIHVAGISNSMDNSYENFKLQKEFVISNPIKYGKILSLNILNNWNFFYSFTTNFTVLQNIFNPTEFMQVIYFVALLICLYKEESSLDLKKLKTFLIILIGLLIISIIYTSLYLQWTSENVGVGGGDIVGVQSRYYVPVMLMFLTCVPSKKDTLNIDENIPWYISVWVNITILIRIMFIVV